MGHPRRDPREHGMSMVMVQSSVVSEPGGMPKRFAWRRVFHRTCHFLSRPGELCGHVEALAGSLARGENE